MKNATAVKWAAFGMFAWGLAKAYAVLGQAHAGGCPICAAADATSPRRLANSVVLGPLMEEVNFRSTLPKILGDQGAALAFGAMHGDQGLGVLGNALRVLEAGLAGGFVYAPAFKNGGLLGSTLVHGAHNLGAVLGAYAVAQQRVRDEGWERAPVPVSYSMTALGADGSSSTMTAPAVALVCRRRRITGQRSG